MLTFYDLARTATALPAAPTTAVAHDTEARIRALEDGLDDYIRGINLISLDGPGYPSVIEDTRKERGTMTTSSA